jgi:hypothetical protein
VARISIGAPETDGVQLPYAGALKELDVRRVPVFLNSDSKHRASKIRLPSLNNVVREFGFWAFEDFDSAFSRLLPQGRGFRRHGGNAARSCLKPESSQCFLQKTRGSPAFQPNASRILSQK